VSYFDGCNDRTEGATSLVIEEAEQQVRIWLQMAHEAYRERRMPRALHYFNRALDYAQHRQKHREVALVCRDLGYVYAQEGSIERALSCFDEGLSSADSDLSVRTGLMANKASVLARLGEYRAALVLLEDSSSLIRSSYPDFSGASSEMVHSYAAIARMAEDLGKVVELLDMGIKPERIQVEIKRHDPPWLSKEQ
jgi:tetratricopeptide (TPR) repeat protein